MPGPFITKQLSIFPSRSTLKEVEAEGLAQLPITSPNELIALMRLQQNTILKLFNKRKVDLI